MDGFGRLITSLVEFGRLLPRMGARELRGLRNTFFALVVFYFAAAVFKFFFDDFNASVIFNFCLWILSITALFVIRRIIAVTAVGEALEATRITPVRRSAEGVGRSSSPVLSPLSELFWKVSLSVFLLASMFFVVVSVIPVKSVVFVFLFPMLVVIAVFVVMAIASSKKAIEITFATTAYLSFLAVLYWIAPSFLGKHFGVSYRYSILLTTALALSGAGFAYYLYQRWLGDPGKARYSWIILSTVGTLVVAGFIVMNPYSLFSHRTGEGTYWYSPTCPDIAYSSPGFCERDGSKLIKLTSGDKLGEEIVKRHLGRQPLSKVSRMIMAKEILVGTYEYKWIQPMRGKFFNQTFIPGTYRVKTNVGVGRLKIRLITGEGWDEFSPGDKMVIPPGQTGQFIFENWSGEKLYLRAALYRIE